MVGPVFVRAWPLGPNPGPLGLGEQVAGGHLEVVVTGVGGIGLVHRGDKACGIGAGGGDFLGVFHVGDLVGNGLLALGLAVAGENEV